MNAKTQECDLFGDIAGCFVDALRRAMRVAAEDDDGNPSPLTQTDLAERADVARSTLAKYLGGRADDAAPNPNLDIICRLADAVGVPPALLLMRPKDWASLGTGMLTFIQAMTDPTFTAMAAKFQTLESTTSPTVVEAALCIGKVLKTVENDLDPKVSQEVRDFRRAAKASIATTAASIPFRLNGVTTAHLPALLTICNILGTTTARGYQ